MFSHLLPIGPLVLFLIGITLGGFTNGLAGFAFSAMAGGLLMMVIPPQMAIALMSAFTICLHICNNIHYFKQIEWKKLLYYFIPGFFGIPIGHWLLVELSRVVVGAIFGIVLLAYAAWMMFKKPHPENNFGGHPGEIVLGFIGGVAAGLLSMPGTPAVIWCNLRGYGKAKQRAFTVPFNLVMLIGNLLLIGMKGGYGDPTLQALGVVGLPFVFLGWFVGIRSFGRVTELNFRRFVLVVFVVSGVALLSPAYKATMNAAGHHSTVVAEATQNGHVPHLAPASAALAAKAPVAASAVHTQ